MFVSFVFLSNLTVADCIINENVMLLFIKNEHFTLLNSVCFWGASSPRPPDQGLCPWTPLGAQPPDPQYSLALPRSASMLTLINRKISDPPSSFSTIRTLHNWNIVPRVTCQREGSLRHNWIILPRIHG